MISSPAVVQSDYQQADHTNDRLPLGRSDRFRDAEAALLFRGANGEPVNAATFSRMWGKARATAGLPPRWVIHGLRHYYATEHCAARAWPQHADCHAQHLRARVAGRAGPDPLAHERS